ncbi:M48 family metallopeptidase [Dongia rigui]|uniref:Protease HtpX homolog n=1 Tax=Dongia rigui TaxID=940149 RepID=A0ABU5E2T2_9PROT|nr:M48 family metallopeptidase [Dongia rigui]MDY0873500.1 M48 family metallopeptidase [Dongia rigui]
MSDLAAPPTVPEDTGSRIHGTDFLAAQSENRRNTWLLIVGLILLGGILGYLIGWALEAWSGDAGFETFVTVSPLGVLGAAVLAGIGIVSSGVTLFAGDRVVTVMAGAKEVTADQEPMLHNVVEEMSIAAGLPKPRVMVIESDALNAFATGMRTDAAVIGVTRGLLKTLPRDQLQGVIAHEMGHILNLDTRYMAAVGIMVGLIALVSDMALRSLRVSGRGSSRSGKKGGGAALVILAILIVFAILAPIAAQMVRFAVSRQREFLADATAVQLTRNPLGLMGALRALAGHASGSEIGNRAIQHVFIVNPVKEFASKTNAFLATHPSIDERIERLQNLGKA